LPNVDDLTYANTGERLNVCMLYADLRGSTKMVDELADTLAAEYYKAFLHSAGELIRRNGGNIQAYDGDRVMAIYLGPDKENQAVSTALELNGVMLDVINPLFAARYGTLHRQLGHTVGIDAGAVLAVKTGVRNANDLVWVGPAANYAAKLNSFDGLDGAYPTRITKAVFDQLKGTQLAYNMTPIWEGPYNNVGRTHYRSSWWRLL
jgi:class 3 adenylate cyclase